MSKIQKLPENVLDAVTPYLLTGEIIEKALLQDNKKPREIWLIKTNQAIILHGQQPDKPQPAIMVLALDEIPEIDYLQKIDDIQLIIYSNKNNGKAVFHFETAASKEIEKFLEDLGDLITYRYQTTKGKITVVQKALPIGHKERKVFGRGKKQEVPFISKKQSDSKENTVSKEAKRVENSPVSSSVVKTNIKTEQPKTNVPSTDNKDKLVLKTNEIKAQPEAKVSKPVSTESPTNNKVSQPDKTIEKPTTKAESNSVLPQAIEKSKKESKHEIKASSSSSIISHLQENPVQRKEPEKEDKPKKEIDYGSPLYFITVTVLATIVGFFCLSFFKTISKVVKYFKRG